MRFLNSMDVPMVARFFAHGARSRRLLITQLTMTHTDQSVVVRLVSPRICLLLFEKIMWSETVTRAGSIVRNDCAKR